MSGRSREVIVNRSDEESANQPRAALGGCSSGCGDGDSGDGVACALGRGARRNRL